MDEQLVCSECQQAISPRGRVLAQAMRAAATQTDITKEANPSFAVIEFLVEDDFEYDSVRIALFVQPTKDGPEFAVGTRIPFRGLFNADVSARMGDAMMKLASAVYEHARGELDAIWYLTLPEPVIDALRHQLTDTITAGEPRA